MVSLWWVKVILLLIAVAVTIHLLETKTLRPVPEKVPACCECSAPEDYV